MKIPGSEEPYQPDGNQINGNDIVQQAGHDQNQNPGYERYQRRKSQVDVHESTSLLVSGCSMSG